MKKKLLLAICLIISSTISALPVTKEKAKKTAMSFIYGNNGTVRMFSTTGPATLQLNEVELDADVNAYYVYNIGENNGFVIISGDDCAEPVLGYSYHGSFDPENIPSNMQAWLSGYERQIEYARNNNIQAPEIRTSGAKVPYRLAIPALLTCKWNQDSPYNDKCPNFKDGHGNRPTGCLATAVSQVMYYHKWPKDPTPEIPGYSYVDDENLGGNGKYKNLDPLPSVTFDWDNMLDEYAKGASKASREAVATLMRYVGQAANMQYCAVASGASSRDIASMLRTYMNYDKGARYVDRTGYSDIEWAELIYNELAGNRPVLYSGTAPGIGGHQFVCDGYENDFFHFNWGWGGVSDGFFKLNALAPSQQGIGGAGNGMHFSERHHIVTGVRPPVEGSVQPEDTPFIGMLALDNNPEGIYTKNNDGTLSIDISSKFGYNAENDRTFTIGLGLYDADNNFIRILKEAERLFEAGYPNPKNNIRGTITFNKDDLKNDGTYYMRAVVKTSDGWEITEKGYNVYFKIVVKGNDVTITQYPYIDVEISDIHFGEMKYQGSEVVITASIKNIGDDMSATVYLTHNNVVDTDVSTEISLRSNEQKNVSLTFVPEESGELSFGISVNGRLFAKENTSTFLPAENKNSNLDFEPEKNITSEGNYMDIPVVITNNTENTYSSLVRAILYTRVGFKYTKETSVLVPVEIAKSGKTNLNIHFDNLKFCETYYLAFAYYSNGREKVYGGVNENTGTPKVKFSKYETPDATVCYDEAGTLSYKVVADGETYDIPEDACLVEMPENISGRTINKNSNPNCIYKFKKGTAVPSSLEGCNVVKEGEAAEINLTDAGSFYSNENINAGRFNVTVRADKELMAVWLPFCPSSATADGVELKQAASIEEMSASDYMLLPIVAEDENTIYCEFAQNAGGKPCIMFVNAKHVGKNIIFSASDVCVDLGSSVVRGVYYNICRSNTTDGYSVPVYGYGEDAFSTEYRPAPFRIYLTAVSASPSKVAVSYPEEFDPAGIENVTAGSEGSIYDVYTIEGVKVKKVVYGNTMLEDLPKGIYIINGRKFVK